MKCILLGLSVVFFALLEGCATYTTTDAPANVDPGYTSYTIGYGGYGGDGTYGSYTPAYWNTSYYYSPNYHYFNWYRPYSGGVKYHSNFSGRGWHR